MSAAATEVRTGGGAVGGRTEDDHRVWRGVPFAAPPVGGLRFQIGRAHV